MRKKVFAAVLALTMALSLAACGSSADSAAPAEEAAEEAVEEEAAEEEEAAPAEEEAVEEEAAEEEAAVDPSDIAIALVPKVAISFFDDCNDGGKEAADALGVNYEWVVPEDTQGSTQVTVMEQLIAKGVDGIAISCNEPQSVEAVIKEAQDAGIAVITFDSDSPDSTRNLYIGTNNFNSGVDMGNFMAEQIGGEGQVAIITGQLGASNLNERIDGIKKAFESYPDIELVDIQGTDDDIAKGVDVCEQYLRTYPDLKGIFGVSQAGGPGTAKVLATQEFADRAEGLCVVAFDDLDDVMAGIDAGTVTATMVQRPVTMGRLAVETLYDMIVNGSNPTEDIDTGCTIVTIENRDSYTK